MSQFIRQQHFMERRTSSSTSRFLSRVSSHLQIKNYHVRYRNYVTTKKRPLFPTQSSRQEKYTIEQLLYRRVKSVHSMTRWISSTFPSWLPHFFFAKTLRIIVLYTQKFVIKLSKIWVGDPGSGIQDPGSGRNLFRVPYPGSKRHHIPDPYPDPQHCKNVQQYLRVFLLLAASPFCLAPPSSSFRFFFSTSVESSRS